MKNAILKNLENLENTTIDLFEKNCIKKSIELVKNNELDKLINEVNFEVKNYQQYINFIFFSQIKKAIEI